MTRSTPSHVPQPSDRPGRSAPRVPLDDAGTDGVLSFLPEGIALPVADINSRRPSTPVDRLRRVALRFWCRQRVRRRIAADGAAEADAPSDRPGRRVCLVSAMGGLAVGVLGTWLLSVPFTAGIPSHRLADLRAAVAPPARAETASAAPDMRLSLDAGLRGAAEHVPGATPAAVSSRTIAPVERSLRRDGSAAPASSRFRGALAFQSDPAGARVVVNGRVVGHTPLLLRDLAVGSRAVRIEAPRYVWWSTAVRVVADETTTVAVRLARAKGRPTALLME